ncbi:MAG: hypothetical protein FWC90_00600 [Oscillospiraceae bacterium]|nr:hypothetical protein [Oscillospiraceae bacterium]
MKYPRPKFNDPSVKIENKLPAFGITRVDVPIFDLPITPRENFRRAAALNKPMWAPCSLTDFQSIMAQDVVYREGDDSIFIHTDFRDHRNAKQDYEFIDWFNTNWTWVSEAGGAMLTPGTMLLEDIATWEKDLKWPDLKQWDFKSKAEDYMKNEYNPGRVMHYDIGRGCTERFISLVGGYTEGMIALAEEPEAVKAWMERYAEWEIELFDTINALYPLDMVTYHDDWGTERDTFFSAKMMEELIFEPSKKIIDHIRSKDVKFELHTCGNITRFMPYILDLDVDFLQLQFRAVDLPDLKAKYGDKVGFCSPIDGYEPGLPREKVLQLVRDSVDTYAPKGGAYFSVASADPEERWDMLAELYMYSREFYEKENG